MKSIFRNTLVKPSAAIALAVAGLLGGTAAQALGTASGTTITNLATLAYTVGGTSQNPIGSSQGGNSSGAGTTTDFLVDNKVNLLVSNMDSTFVPVVPSLTVAAVTALQVATFKLKNTGNTAQGFLLTTANLANGTSLFGGTDTINDVGLSACTIKVDTAVSAVGGLVTPAGYVTAVAVTSVATLTADTEKIVYVVCPIAATAVDGDIAVISLSAQAVTATTLAVLIETSGVNNNSVVDIVFADIAGTDDIARDAKSSSRGAFKVSSAKLTVTKTATPVCDPFNGATNPKNIPGSYVNYTITIANDSTAATSATLGTVTDPLNLNLTFDPELIVGASAAGCTTVALGGVRTDSLGNVKVVQSTRGISAFKTSASDSDGVTLSLSGSIYTLAIDFGTVLPAIGGSYTAGELKKGESVSVTFQAKIN